MVARAHVIYELGTIFLWVAVVVLLLLIVVVPAHSQTQPPANSQAVEIIDDQPQQMSPAVLAFLILQFLFLAGMMISYMIFSSRLMAQRQTNFSRHHHWWQRLHLHH